MGDFLDAAKNLLGGDAISGLENQAIDAAKGALGNIPGVGGIAQNLLGGLGGNQAAAQGTADDSDAQTQDDNSDDSGSDDSSN